MKVSINEDGKMTVTAECPTEAYALRQWWYSFDKGGNMQSDPRTLPSALGVDWESWAIRTRPYERDPDLAP